MNTNDAVAKPWPATAAGARCFRGPWFVLLLSLLLWPGLALAAFERSGVTPSGAVYRVAVPEGWRAGDGLVVYQHGLSFELDRNPGLGPLLDLQLAQGYAVAASGYRQTGWASFASGQDNRELVERFTLEFGAPGRILTYGSAMGGHIALQMAEDPQLPVDGALALCPVAAGHRNWDAALDLRVVYDAVCGDVEGGALPGADDQPWLLPDSEVSAAGLGNLVRRANRCLGLDQAPWLRSEAQRQRLERVSRTLGIDDEAMLLLNLGYATLGLSDLIRDPAKLGGRIGLGNDGVDYGDEELNRQVRRIESDPFAALDFRVRAGLRGLGGARVVSVHAIGDALVSSGHQAWLRERWPSLQLSSVLVDDADSGGQCRLSGPETVAAWTGLHDWLDGDDRPDAVELQARCLALLDDGAAGECRIDPELEPDELDLAIRPRPGAVTELDGRFSGSWFDPERSGEGWLIEILDRHTAQLYGFTFPASGDAGDQLWLTGTGQISGDGIVFDQVDRLSADGAVGGFDADAPVRVRQWGRIQISFGECGRARMRFQGPEGYGAGERDLRQLMHLGGQSCSASGADASGIGAFSGSWFDPDRAGQGLVVNSRADGLAAAVWFGFSPTDGTPVWLYGQGVMDGNGRLRLDSLVRPHGARFERVDAGTVSAGRWGELEVDFDSCGQARMRYRSDDPGIGSGELPLVRLTTPVDLGACPLP